MFAMISGGWPGESAGDHLALADHDDAVVAEVEAASAVFLRVDADARTGRDDDVLVDDRPLDDGALADVDAVEQHALIDLGARVDAHAGREHRLLHLPAGDDAPRRDQRVDRVPGAPRL